MQKLTYFLWKCHMQILYTKIYRIYKYSTLSNYWYSKSDIYQHKSLGKSATDF